jgi:NADH-quinone oxidoreductase subunit M
MPELDLIWMSLVVFIPTVFAVGLVFFPKGWEEAMRWWSLFGTALTLGVSICVFFLYGMQVVDHYSSGDKDAARHKISLLQRTDAADSAAAAAKPPDPENWIARYPWIPRFNIEYFLGADGISLPLILLTTVLSFLAMIASWNITRFVRGYCILFLVLETGMLGTFLALDFFLFYIFWEIMLLPMYFLIGVWGGPRREYAAIKFFLYTLLGSVFILIALLAFYFTDVRDFVSPEKTAAGARAKVPALVVSALDTAEKTYNQARERLTTARDELKQAQDDLEKKKDDAARKADVEAKKKTFDAAEGPYIDAIVKFDAARLAFEVEAAKKSGPVNSFDLVLLQRVGTAAMQHRNGQAVLAPAVMRAEKQRTEMKSRYEALVAREGNSRLAQAAKKNEQDAQAAVDAAKKGLDERLVQPFFQGWFQKLMFIFLFIGFAIKVPVFPFHTWLPDAHVEAPTPISMILAGVLLKFGGYGIIRIAYPICPWAAHEWAYGIALFGIINIVYGALAAMAQTDFKKLVAYSSVSHMGYVILGIAVWSSSPDQPQYWTWAMNGAMFQMIAHGLTSAGMFFLVGVIYDRAHHRNLDNFRGLYEPMPLYGGISAVIFFAAMGLPGLCGFVGEFMVVLGTWNFDKTFAVLAAATVVLTAAYILWTIQRVFMGTNPTYKNYADINPRELTAIIPLVVLSVLFGVAPALILNWMEPSVTGLIDTLLAAR